MCRRNIKKNISSADLSVVFIGIYMQLTINKPTHVKQLKQGVLKG
jgi:hypothetical protein